MNQLQRLKMALIAYVNSIKAVWSAMAHPLSIVSKRKGTLKDYRIYGNSVQEGEPTPENPIEVQSVGELTTKNLWTEDNYYSSSVGGSVAIRKNLYVSKNTWIQGGVTFTISATVCVNDERTSSRLSVQTSYTDGTKSDVKRANFSVRGEEIRLTLSYTIPLTEKEIDGLEIRFIDYSSNSSGVWDAYVKDIQIELGDTATEYEPYHKYRVPITVKGKNLFDQNIWSDLFDLVNNEYYQSNTTIVTDESIRDFYLEAGTYTLSYASKAPVGKNYRIVFIYEDGTMYNPYFVSTGEWIEKSLKLTFTQKVVKVRWHYSSQSNEVCFKNIQLEKSDTASDYEPYIEPQTHNIYLDEPLRKVGDYVDVVDFDKGVVVRNVGKKVFDGTEPWSLDATTKYNNLLFQCRVESYRTFATNELVSLSNKVISIPWGTLWRNYYKETGSTNLTVGVSIVYNANDGSGASVLYIKVTPYSTLPTVDEWKAQLATWYEEGTPFTVWYVVPTKEEAIELPQLPQFKGTTIYEVKADVMPSGMEVCYYE